jgi:hypothetical protein
MGNDNGNMGDDNRNIALSFRANACLGFVGRQDTMVVCFMVSKAEAIRTLWHHHHHPLRWPSTQKKVNMRRASPSYASFLSVTILHMVCEEYLGLVHFLRLDQLTIHTVLVSCTLTIIQSEGGAFSLQCLANHIFVSLFTIVCLTHFHRLPFAQALEGHRLRG